MIEKLKKDGKEWIDDRGVSWDSRADYLFIHVLHTCGCGDPSSIGKYVLEMLTTRVVDNDYSRKKKEDISQWDQCSYEDLPLMFFLSWADHEGYIEHGITIRCSWLTDKGRELINDLKTILSEEEQE